MAVAIDPHHHNGFKLFTRSQICRLQSFSHLDNYNIFELGQTNLACSLRQAFDVANNFHRSFSTPCFSPTNGGFEDVFRRNDSVEILGGLGLPRVHDLVVEVAIALASGINPVPLSNGLGGAYLLCSRNGDRIAVAKPIDEEPLALNNPKGFGGLKPGQPGKKRSVAVGDTGMREVAAYLLDHDGFAGVPPTALVKIVNAGFYVSDATSLSYSPYKIASLQRFVDHDFDAGELGPIGFSVGSVHRVGILDIRLLNLDRHAGNILVKRDNLLKHYAVGTAELVPIDHGLCLPESLDDPYFEWLHWPQASVPFSESELEYISNLDPFTDAEILRIDLPSVRESSIRILILCTILLKQAAAAGLCLANIGEMMTREFGACAENLSVLENLCVKAKASINKPTNDIVDDDDSGNETANCQDKGENEVSSAEVLDIPDLSQCALGMSKPPKVSKFSSAKSMPVLHHDTLSHALYKEIAFEDDNAGDIDSNNGTVTIKDNSEDDNEDNNSLNEGVIGGFIKRSMSNVAENYCNNEIEGISLNEMNEAEWKTFLECFEKDLLEVLEDIKFNSSKQRLGTSCEF